MRTINGQASGAFAPIIGEAVTTRRPFYARSKAILVTPHSGMPMTWIKSKKAILFASTTAALLSSFGKKIPCKIHSCLLKPVTAIASCARSLLRSMLPSSCNKRKIYWICFMASMSLISVSLVENQHFSKITLSVYYTDARRNTQNPSSTF